MDLIAVATRCLKVGFSSRVSGVPPFRPIAKIIPDKNATAATNNMVYRPAVIGS